jgi:hypothetical protein
MSVKQYCIILGILTSANATIEALLWGFHIHKSIALHGIIVFALLVGYGVAKLEKMWERDREQVRLVTERLLRKPEPLDVAGDMAKLQGQWAKGILAYASATNISNAASHQLNAALLGGQATSNGQRTLASITGADNGKSVGKR